MEKFWMLVASRTKARIFEAHSVNEPLILRAEFDNPEGYLKEQDLVSDKPGRVLNRATGQRSAYEPKMGHYEHDIDQFARFLADEIERGAYTNSYDGLVVAALPELLGRIRGYLGTHTTRKLRRTVAKELITEDARGLHRHIEGLGVTEVRAPQG